MVTIAIPTLQKKNLVAKMAQGRDKVGIFIPLTPFGIAVIMLAENTEDTHKSETGAILHVRIILKNVAVRRHKVKVQVSESFVSGPEDRVAKIHVTETILALQVLAYVVKSQATW